MDETVERALKRWPDVPHCTGWLWLDARGHWRMRDAAAQAAHARGTPIRHAALLAFICRNYGCDERGQWFFQNGPQRVYVELEYTPWVVRLTRDAHGSLTLTDQTGQPFAPARAWLDDAGNVLFDEAAPSPATTAATAKQTGCADNHAQAAMTAQPSASPENAHHSGDETNRHTAPSPITTATMQTRCCTRNHAQVAATAQPSTPPENACRPGDETNRHTAPSLTTVTTVQTRCADNHAQAAMTAQPSASPENAHCPDDATNPMNRPTAPPPTETNTPARIAVLHDHDLGLFADHASLPDEDDASRGGLFHWRANLALPLRPIRRDEVATRFGFVASPADAARQPGH